MQKSLKLLALFIAAAYPALAFATIAGIPAPVAVAAETGLGLYSIAFVALLALRDYHRTPPTLRLPPPVLLPAREAFATNSLTPRRATLRRSFRAPQVY